jgi:YHS domain-containing protein
MTTKTSKFISLFNTIFSLAEFVPVDPVCGIELDEDLALIHDHDGKKFYFCCNGCRRIFIKKPRKYKNN